MFTRLLLLGLLCCTVPAQSAVLFSTNSTWRFVRGTNEASLPDTTHWRTNDFADVNFADAPAPFWYGDARPGGTPLTDMMNLYSCVFLRKTFTVPDATGVGALRLTHYIDDGFVAWLNGRELYRENVSVTTLSTNTLAANQPTDPAVFTTVTVPLNPGDLRSGENLIAVQVFNTTLNSSDLGFDLMLESVVSETVPPVITSVSPPPGSVTQLTQITVTFSEPVQGVNADDLLLNTQPAASVTGSGAIYTFSFGQPLYGNVSITWFPTHGIRDEALPPNAFDGTAPGATWQYNLVDTIPPGVASLFPPAGVTVRTLNQIEVTFDEEVSGVNASDLLINGQPATSVSRIPGGPYVFQFPTPPINTVPVQWAIGHGITDQAAVPNAFAGGSWSYVYDPNSSVGDLIINEIVASNQSGLADEDGETHDWVEIYNRGSTTVNLANWSLSDDPEIPGLWTFPARSLAPGEYLVIFASGKDRKPVSGPNRMHTLFQLAQDGEHLGLYTPESPRVLASGYSPFPEQRNDTSYGYDTVGNLRYFATPSPGGPNGTSTIVGVAEEVHFSVARGAFNQPFNLAITCPTPGTTIRFTTDGTVPTANSGAAYFSPLRITNTTILRAGAFRTNLLPSTVATHTYFFGLTAARASLPIISLVTASSNLHGRTGIIGMGGGSRAGDGLFITNNPATDYHNPSAHGIAWERPVSAEYILPQDNSGFQIDCGIRVQGSDWQRPRTTSSSKFSFRLYFRGDYGKGRLEYPLFPLSTVESFDQVVLRAGFNDNSNPFIRDELTRRLSHDMGQVASHGGFMNLFTNGVYWGYYNPTERVHSEMMQSYLGGSDQWDVVTPSFATSSSGLGVVDGDRNNFQNMMTNVWGTSLRPVTTAAAYTGLSKRLDLANFADYCLLNAYTAMGDWPANNWRAARDRGNPDALWRFIVWDAEWGHGFDSHAITTDSFVLSGTGTLDAGLSSTGNSEIARLYQALRVNREFRLLWADRIHKHFFNGGALMSLTVSNRVQEMRTELQSMFTITDTEFLNWHRDRLPPLFGQFNTYGLYGYSNALYGVFASSNAPAFNQHGGPVVPGFVLTMTAPLGGTIYFTTNGHDPRVPFSGAVSNAATAYTGPVTLNQSMTVKARTLLNDTNWSALAEANFHVASLGVPLRVTELNYNPTNSAHEFIEIQNTGGTPIDLGGMTFSGISYTFLEGAVLAGGQRLVLVTDSILNPAAFAARYPGVAVFGYYGGALNNGGETISLQDVNGNLIFSVTYDNAGGWPTAADGAGSSLEIINPYGDPDDPSNWRASTQPGGSPGAVNSTPPAPVVRLNEVMAENGGIVNHAGTFPDWVELFNPGGAPVNLAGWSLTDDGSARKFVFPVGAQIPASGYLVVWCDDTTNTSPGLHTGFALGRMGDTVQLFDPATNRVDAITFGLQLTNHSIGRVGSDWVLSTPTVNAANAAASLAPASSLVINEWLANPPSGQSDWLELHNPAAQPVALRGLYLSNTSSVHQITSLSFVAPQGFVQLFADELVGPDHLDFKLPAAGGTIVLYDQTTVEIDRVSYTVQTENISRGRLPDGSETFVIFPGTASPGASNYASAGGGSILINELLARNQTAVTNAGRVADFVELHNPYGTNFPLDGFSLSVDESEPGQWPFPFGASVPAGGYLVIWCDGSRPASIGLGDHNTGRSLDGESGGAYLFNPAGQVIASVEYGFQVADRSIGLVSGNWRLLTAPTPGAVNAAPVATFGASTMLRFNEWMANPVSGGDWFELFNPTNQPIDLTGLILTDDLSIVGQTRFRIAPLSFIGPNNFVKWEADNDPEQGRHHVNFSLDAQGESLRLYATNGTTLIDSITFGIQTLAVSEGRLPDGQSNIVAFAGSPTPGESNYLPAPEVVISEVLTHTDPPLEDAVELRNTGTSTLNIGGWFLSDAQDNFKKYRVPDNTLIPAGVVVVFNQSQFGVSSQIPFTLDSARGDQVWLSAADAAGNLTGYRTGARFGAAANGVSLGRIVTSLGVDYAALSQRTLGSSLPNAAPLVGPIVINELMYHPADGPVTTADDEYIELRNLTASPVQLFDPANPANTWRLGGGVEFTFPPNTNVAANGLVLVVPFAPGNPTALAQFRSKYNVPVNVPVFGPYAGQLNNAGESIELFRPDTPQPVGEPDAGFVPQLLVDKVNYGDSAPWPAGDVDGGGLSLQRRIGASYGNEPLNWLASAPTAGAANGSGVVPPPVITVSPQDQQVLEGDAPLLAVAASGAGPVGYQWRFNGIPVPAATNHSLAFDYAVLADNGDYDCIVSNPGGAALSAAARLTVLAPAAVVIPPTGSTNRPGSNVTFTVVAKGSAPLRYQWQFNGSTLFGETNASLLRTNTQLIDDGIYDVVIANNVSATIASTRLTILVNTAVIVPPTTNIFVVTGATYSVSVAATGNPLPFGYEWREGSRSIRSNTVQSTVHFETFTAPMMLTNHQPWRVVVRNLANPGTSANISYTVTTLLDVDSDGIPDNWESDFGFNPGSAADRDLDSDNDGATNWEEYLAGTNPTNELSHLRLGLPAFGPNSTTLQFGAVSNRTYSIHFNDALGSLWQRLADVVSRTNARTETVFDPGGNTNRFYRVVTPRQP